MANDVVFTVEGKGKNLKKTANEAGDIGKNVDKSNAALDKAGKKQDSYNRREKGIFQTNLSSGKAYSKLAQNIGGGGSSSLVGAYATLAANVFALTAAFNALKNASQFEQLVQGLNAVGDAAGRNLTHLGSKLQDVTGHAISAERAMRAVAIGTSAGFSAEQLEKLSTVAKGASIALGRDMGDAIDRLIRGAAKLEPEILDELGIMVRLDDAAEDYATSLGKTAAQLTQFERRMAFVTAINEQGLEKFEGIANAVDPTPYDQLSASLDNLMKSGLTLLNTFLTPMINLMANSTGVLIGTITLFGSTISRQMLPFLHDTADRARAAADQFAKMNSVSRDNIVTTGALPPKYKKLSKSIVDGTASMEEMQVVQKELANSEKHRAGMLRNLNEEQDPKEYAKVKAGLDNVRKAQTELTKVTEGHLGVLARTKAADAMTMTSLSDMPKGWAKLNEAILDNNEQIDLNVEKQGREVKARDKASKAAFKYGQRIKFVGASLVRAVPFIGLAVTAVGLLSAAFDKFFPGEKLKLATDDAVKGFDRINEITEALIKATAKATDAVTILKNQYRALAGVVQTSRDVIGSINTAIIKSQSEQIDKQIDEMLEIQRNIRRLETEGDPRLTGRGVDAAVKKEEVRLAGSIKRLDKLKDALGKFDKEALDNLERGTAISIAKMEVFSKANGNIASAEIAGYQAILKGLQDGTIKNTEELINEMDAVTKPSQNFQASMDGAGAAMGEFLKSVNKMGQVATTPFDSALESLDAILVSMNAIDDKAQLAFDSTLKTAKMTVNAQGQAQSVVQQAAAARRAEEEKLFKTLAEQYKLEETFGTKTRAEFKAYVKKISEAVTELRKMTGVIKRLKQIEKDTASFTKSQFINRALATKTSIEATENRIRMEQKYNKKAMETNEALILRVDQDKFRELSQKKVNELTVAEQRLLKEMQEALKSNAKLAADNLALEDEAVQLKLKSHKVAVAEAEDKMAALKITQQMVALERQRVNLLKTQESNQANLAAMRDRVRRGQGRETLSPAEEFKLFLQREARERAMLDREHKIKVAMIKAEDTLMKAKVELNKMEAKLLLDRTLENEKDIIKQQNAKNNYVDFVRSADDYVAAMSPLLQMRIDVANLENKVAHSTLSVEKEKLGLASRRGGLAAMESARGDRRQGGGTGIAGIDATAALLARRRERLTAAKATARSDAEAKAVAGFGGQEAIDAMPAGLRENMMADVTARGDEAAHAVKNASFFDQDGTITEKMTLLRSLTAGLNEELRQLGPEGEVAAAVGEGAMNIGTSIGFVMDTFDETENKAARGAAIASGIAATISATANIMKAASDARVAGIDREIAAEKKRDGTSKKSLAKIKALEAKKEQMKKKAFETDKKMRMAQIVASTAASIMGVVSGVKSFWEAPLAIAAAAMFAAMGAAQLAIVSGLSYQGGAGGGVQTPSAPSQISMGQRNNKVDISGGRGNAAGELAYLRGDRGFGTGAADFRPAFAGRKYRAAGGAAYVVGEQGPELFVPSVPGRVVSNDDMEAAAPSNVNFTINAIDAAGVEEVLVEQRGNIIGMLRESANEYGTGFLEEVNEDSYTSTTEGSVYGRA